MGVEKIFRAIHRRHEMSFRRIRHASEARRPAIFAPSTHPIEALVVPAAVGHIRRTYPVTPAVFGDGDGEGGVLSGARTGFDTGRHGKRRRFGTAVSVAAAEGGLAVPGAVHLATPPPPSLKGVGGSRARVPRAWSRAAT